MSSSSLLSSTSISLSELDSGSSIKYLQKRGGLIKCQQTSFYAVCFPLCLWETFMFKTLFTTLLLYIFNIRFPCSRHKKQHPHLQESWGDSMRFYFNHGSAGSQTGLKQSVKWSKCLHQPTIWINLGRKTFSFFLTDLFWIHHKNSFIISAFEVWL